MRQLQNQLKITISMSKYEPLWQYLANQSDDTITLSFDEIAKITGFGFDHSFLTYKKELYAYGWRFNNLSLKHRYVVFKRRQD